MGRQSALHTENSWFASPTLGRHISTFRGYRILFSIRNPHIIASPIIFLFIHNHLTLRKWRYTPLHHDFALDPIIPPFDFHFRIYKCDLAILTEWWQQRIAWWELINASCQIIGSIICIRKQHANHMEDDTLKNILQDKQSIYWSKQSRRKQYRMCWKEKIQWQSVTNGLPNEHVLRLSFLDKVPHHFVF